MVQYSNISTTKAPVVYTQKLTKVFRDFWMRDQVRAVDKLDMEVKSGEIFGLIGPNGSGKSTTIKIILGLLHKTSGRIAVFGKPPTDVTVKKRIGYLPEESYLYPFLNSRETLDFYGKLFGYDRRIRNRRINELLAMVGLEAVQYRPIGQFSKGMQRRIGLAQALINDPDFLILDEPTSGLDPIGIRQVKDLIIDLGKRGKTILLSSHMLADVEDVCDRMAILYGGKKRSEGISDELLASHERTVIEVESLGTEQAQRVADAIFSQEGKHVLKISPARQTLESLFLDIVNKAQIERAQTHGATSGGPTAAFLRNGTDSDDAPAVVGSELIEHLVGSNTDGAGDEIPGNAATTGNYDKKPTSDYYSAESTEEPDLINQLLQESYAEQNSAQEPVTSETDDLDSSPAAESDNQADSDNKKSTSDQVVDGSESADRGIIDSLLADSDSSSDNDDTLHNG